MRQIFELTLNSHLLPFFFLGTFNYIFLFQITICSCHYELSDIWLWKKWYWSVWPVMDFEGSSSFRKVIKFYQSTVISHVFYFHQNRCTNLKSVIFFYICNILNFRVYYSDHLYELSNILRRTTFLTDYSDNLFSSYKTEVIFRNRIDDLFFVMGKQFVYFEAEGTFSYIIYIRIIFKKIKVLSVLFLREM
jgi:hypothetical protein